MTIAVKCETCKIPTQKEVTPQTCSGYKDGAIRTLINCTTWIACPKKLTIAEALAYASSAGIKVTRPTMIHWCVAHSIGKRVPNVSWGRWIIDTGALKKLLRED